MLAFLAKVVERFEHHGQQLQNDARADIRHDAKGEDRQIPERAAAEHVEEPEQPRALLVHHRVHDGAIDPRNRHEDADPVDRQEPDRENDPPPELGHLADVGER